MIYARLCKDLDLDLPQKVEQTEQERKKSSKRCSIFRTKLIEKCKKIFKEEGVLFDPNKFTDQEEREQLEKDYILGSKILFLNNLDVNFIGEMIKVKILSKNVVFQCMDYLLKSIEEKTINIEGIVMLLDKFGTEINNGLQDGSTLVKQSEIKDLNEKLEVYFDMLKEISNTKSNLPGFIKYKIINLVEKKNRGWHESKVDQVLKIKTLKEVHEEYEQELKDNSNAINNNYNNNNNNNNLNSSFNSKKDTYDYSYVRKFLNIFRLTSKSLVI